LYEEQSVKNSGLSFSFMATNPLHCHCLNGNFIQLISDVKIGIREAKADLNPNRAVV
jgi:hypothetical protein